jgi:hypothetical protein
MPNPNLKPGPGRPKGVPNKTTQAVKDLITQAFEEKGGLEAFVAWARKNETEFYKIWSKLLPVQLTGRDQGPIQTADVSGAREELRRRIDGIAERMGTDGRDRPTH